MYGFIVDEEYFSIESANVLDELTQGKVLQAQVVSRAEDLVPYIHLYQISGNRVRMIIFFFNTDY